MLDTKRFTKILRLKIFWKISFEFIFKIYAETRRNVSTAKKFSFEVKFYARKFLNFLDKIFEYEILFKLKLSIKNYLFVMIYYK